MINISRYSSEYYFPKNKNCSLFLLNPGSVNYAIEIIKTNNVETIYYKSELLGSSLKKNPIFFNIKKVKIGNNFLLSFIKLFIILLKIKIKKKNVFFFHESSWLELDILLNLIKPKGYHYLTSAVEDMNLYTKINNFFDISDLSISKKIIYSILKFFLKKFNFYHRKKNKNNLPIFIFCNFYHSDIEKYFFLIKREVRKNQKNILFLVSIDLLSEENNLKQSNIYNSLINSFSKLGYNCFVKDHPNKSSRLNLLNDNCKQMNHNEPVELSDQKFDWVIGSTSSSLFNFSKSISIIKIYMQKMEYDEILKFFFRSKANHILTPESSDKIINLIDNNKNYL